MSGKNKSKEIHIVRVYDAPVKAVWDAWNDTKQAAQWWGPRGFTITTHSKDLKPGGHWHYTMHGPDGTDYVNKTKYFEVEKYSRLVYDHGGNDEQAPLFRVTATFSEVTGGKTRLEMSMAFPSPEIAEESRKFIKKANGDSTWDRLAEYLETESTGKDTFVINRSFDAPIDVVYDMWTNPEHFSKWLAPTGFNMKFHKADLRPGGSTFYSMTDGKDVTMYGRAKYLEMTKPTRVVYTQQFTDEKNDKTTRHPMAPTWPATMRTTVLFSEEGPDRTRVTVTWEIEGEATREEAATFKAAKSGMTGGWTGSFDKLEDYLTQRT